MIGGAEGALLAPIVILIFFTIPFIYFAVALCLLIAGIQCAIQRKVVRATLCITFFFLMYAAWVGFIWQYWPLHQ